jgi:hypothetical protein
VQPVFGNFFNEIKVLHTTAGLFVLRVPERASFLRYLKRKSTFRSYPWVATEPEGRRVVNSFLSIANAYMDTVRRAIAGELSWT